MIGLTVQITQAWNCPWKKHLNYKSFGRFFPGSLTWNSTALTLQNSASLIGQICGDAFVANEGIGVPSSSVIDKLSFEVPLQGYHYQIINDVSCCIFVKHVGSVQFLPENNF